MILLAPHLVNIVDTDDGLYAVMSPPAASPRSAANFMVSRARFACCNRHRAASQQLRELCLFVPLPISLAAR